MKKYILASLVVLFVYNMIHAQINGTIEWKQGVDFSIQIGSEYTEILTKSMCYTEEVGSPKIPYCVKSFVLPNNVKVSTVRITSVTRHLIGENLLIIPAQYPIPIGQDYLGWTGPNDEVYNSSKPFPGMDVEIISDRVDFGYHIVSVKFFPMEYIPFEKKLYLCNLSFSLEYSMDRAISRASSVPEKRSKRLSLLDREYIRSIVDNADMLESPTQYMNLELSPVEVAVPEYLIITSESLKNAFQLLADWKIKKGTPTIIETVENIVGKYRGADTQEKIRNYLIDIKSRYGSLFVLLGGDTNVIPARLKKTRQGGKKDLYAVDFYYTCAGNGDWSIKGDGMFVDSFGINAFGLEFKLGRAPVENQTEAEVFVNKVINYEKCIGVEDTRYYNNTLVADAFIASGSCNTYLLYYEGKDTLVINYHEYKNNGNDFAKSWFIYDDYLGIDALRCMYRDIRGSWHFVECDEKKHLSDPIPGGICRFQGNEELTSASFLNALNNGGNSNYGHFHIVYHMDHSSPNSMGTSSLMKNQSINKFDVDRLSNGNYNQIVISGGCTPADITKDCIAEHFLNNPNGGAVAFIGNTDIGWAYEYTQFQCFCNELYKKTLASTDRFDLSYLHIKANTLRKVPVSAGYCSLHLFGDPEMQVWTGVPRSLDVSITPSSIRNEKSTITVTINNLPSSQAATVCLQKKDEVYTVQTMQNGTQTFVVTPKTTGTLEVTITAHNFRPFETTIPVSVSPNAVLHISDFVFDDDKVGDSNGNSDKQLDAGETIELSVALKNEGAVTSGTVIGELTCSSPEITIINDAVPFGEIKAGSTQASGKKFVFAIDRDCKEHLKNGKEPIEFIFTIKNGTNSTSEHFQVDIFAPEIEIGNQKITWTSNGNTTVEASETVKMNIDLMNIGQAEATGLKAVLISNNPQVSCSSTS